QLEGTDENKARVLFEPLPVEEPEPQPEPEPEPEPQPEPEPEPQPQPDPDSPGCIPGLMRQISRLFKGTE
ncbi:MAG: hypothetical protein AB8I58_19060, partial [Anaerolineales bacterium]